MRQEKVETTTTCRRARKKWGVEKAEPAAGDERRRGRREKKEVAGQVREDVVTEVGRRAAEISYNFFFPFFCLFWVGIKQRSSGFHHNALLAGILKECNEMSVSAIDCSST